MTTGDPGVLQFSQVVPSADFCVSAAYTSLQGFLQSQRIVNPPAYSNLLAALLHPLVTYLLMHPLGKAFHKVDQAFLGLCKGKCAAAPPGHLPADAPPRYMYTASNMAHQAPVGLADRSAQLLTQLSRHTQHTSCEFLLDTRRLGPCQHALLPGLLTSQRYPFSGAQWVSCK